MKKNRINITLSVIGIVTITFMLSSCGINGSSNEKQKQREYLAVGLSNSNNWSIIDKDGNVVVDTEFPITGTAISNVYDDVYWVRSGGRCLLYSVNQPNQPLLEEERADAADFVCYDHTPLATSGQPIHIINTKGETVTTLPENIMSCQSFGVEGYAIFEDENRRLGVIDKDGKIVIEATYAKLVPLGEGIFWADQSLFIDANGNVIGKIDNSKYTMINLGIEDGKILVRDANYNTTQCYAINTKGEQLFTLQTAAKKASYYRDGYAMFQSPSGQWGVVDDRGKVVVSPNYRMLFNLGGGDFIAMGDGGFGVINAKGETIVDFNYNDIDPEKLGSNFIMGRNYDYMLINRKGEELATFRKIGQIGHNIVRRLK